ncbi:MAG: RHS repeat-associated core domain-containing protein, partial [Thermoanaerobaculia bacterium]
AFAAVGNLQRTVTTDGFGRVIQTVTPNPGVVNAAAEQVGYDTRGRVVWRARLDAAHAMPAVPYAKPLMTTPGLLSMEEIGYDLADRVTSESHWVIQTQEIYTVTSVYDDLHRTITVTDRGAVTVTSFDGRGRVVGRTFPDKSTMTVVHNLDNDVVTLQTNQGAPLIRTLQYDTRHNLIGVLDENNKPLYWGMYDDAGNLWNEQVTGSGSVLRTFDVLDRLHIQTRDSLNGQKITETFDWDANDRLRAKHDGLGNTWSTILGGFDQTLSATDPATRVTTFSYVAGYAPPSGSIDATGRHSCYRYDTELRRQYVYDADCPASNHITGAAAPLMERRMYQYDALGQLTQIATGADAAHPTRDTVSYKYDSLGRATDETVEALLVGGESYNVHRTFADQGRTVTTQVFGNLIGQAPPPPDPPPMCCVGRFCSPCPPPPPPLTPWVASFRNGHDTFGRLTSVDLNGSRLATWNNGVGIGGPSSLVYGNGTSTSFAHDNRLRQTNMTVTGPLSGGLQLAARTLAPNIAPSTGGGGGCPPGFWCPPPQTTPFIASLTDAFGADSIPRMRQRRIGMGPVLTDVYQIDGNERVTAENLQLTGVMLPTGEIDDTNISPYLSTGSRWRYFDVDANGNWRSTASAASGGTNVDHTIDVLGRLTAVGGQPSNIDAQDNLQRVAADTIAFTFEPLWGLPLSAANGGAVDQYSYDAANRRTTEKHFDGSTTVFLWAGDQMVAHGDPGNLTIDVPGDDIDSHVASVAGAGAGAIRYYHAGPDQSVLSITDGSGALIEGYSYSSFGDVTISDPNGNVLPGSRVGNRFLFQGQLYDPLTATYSMRARQYSPKWGRFLSPDPLGIASEPSLYAFTGSRPLSYRDPLGLDDTDWGSSNSILGGILGGII